MNKFINLIPHRRNHLGMAMAKRTYPPSGKKIQILPAVNIYQFHALTLNKNYRAPGIGRHYIVLIGLEYLLLLHPAPSFIISVPIPSSVKISKSRAWEIRASMICAFLTLASKAATQEFTLGIIPA